MLKAHLKLADAQLVARHMLLVNDFVQHAVRHYSQVVNNNLGDNNKRLDARGVRHMSPTVLIPVRTVGYG